MSQTTNPEADAAHDLAARTLSEISGQFRGVNMAADVGVLMAIATQLNAIREELLVRRRS